MKRYLLAGLSALVLSAAVTEVAKAETVITAPKATTATASFVTQTNPFNLVRLAYRGQFKDTGIPSYGALISAIQSNQVTAEDIVKSAISQRRVSPETLNDEGFLRAVEAQLKDLNVSNRS